MDTESAAAELFTMNGSNLPHLNWEGEERIKGRKEEFLGCLQEKVMFKNMKEITRCSTKCTPFPLDFVITKQDRVVVQPQLCYPLSKSAHVKGKCTACVPLQEATPIMVIGCREIGF